MPSLVFHLKLHPQTYPPNFATLELDKIESTAIDDSNRNISNYHGPGHGRDGAPCYCIRPRIIGVTGATYPNLVLRFSLGDVGCRKIPVQEQGADAMPLDPSRKQMRATSNAAELRRPYTTRAAHKHMQ